MGGGIKKMILRKNIAPCMKINKLVPRADRFMKIYINHPQTTCFYPAKWRLEIPSRLGGVQ